MSGGGTRTETRTENQRRDPWEPAQPALQGILAGAQRAYDSGVGSQVYAGDRTAGLGDVTQAGLGSLIANAGGAAGTAQAGNSFLGGLLSMGGATAPGAAALNDIRGVPTVDTTAAREAAARMADPNGASALAGRRIVGGEFNQDGAGYRDLNAGLAGPSQTQRSLQDVADGRFLNGGNPYLDQIINQGQQDATSAVASRFAASGRYGSGRFAGAVADANNRIGTNLRYQDYGTERDRQAQAAGAIDAAGLARTSARAGLYGADNATRSANAGLLQAGAGLASGADAEALRGALSVAGLEQGNNAQRLAQAGTALSASQSDRAAGLAGLGAVSGVQSDLLAPGRTLAQAGAIQDADRQAQLDEAAGLFAERQAAPWQQLGLASGVINPIAGLGGTSEGTTRTPVRQPGLLQSLVGGLSSGVGLAGQLGLLSDERAKEDIEPVGELNDGQTVYSYRYKGDDTPQIGLLAQEVRKKVPRAVGKTPSGLLAVDYKAATAKSARMGAR